MFNFNHPIDRLSFWLGFLAATLLWWLVSRVRPQLPIWRRQIRQWFDLLSLRNLAGVEESLRRETIRRVQRQHIAAPLFALDEIIIEPHLLAPPIGQDPDESEPAPTVAGKIIPYLPDWPEVVTPLGVPLLTLAEALQSGRNLAVIGQPGTGKTVALAYLAAQIARRSPELGDYANSAVIYLHILDLDIGTGDHPDPIKTLIRSASASTSVVLQPQAARFLQTVLRGQQRRVVLVLDGLDELSREKLTEVTAYLRALAEKSTALQIVTTAAPEYVDGLTRAGFYPLALATWTASQKTAFTRRWNEQWQSKLAVENHQPALVEPKLLTNWLTSETDYASPLEWTLRVWGAYSGDLSGSSSSSAIEAACARFLPKPGLLPALAQLGHHMAERMTTSLDSTEMERVLTGYKPGRAAVFTTEVDEFESAAVMVASPISGGPEEPGLAGAADLVSSKNAPADLRGQLLPSEEKRPSASPRQKQARGSRVDTLASQGEQIITALIAGGILVEHSNHRLRFVNPVILGWLAAQHTTAEEASALVSTVNQKNEWPPALQVLRFTAARTLTADWVNPLIAAPAGPLYRGLLIAARWLADSPVTADWRAPVMRSLANLIQSETLPQGIRVRVTGAFYLSRDASTPRLFKQLLSHRTASVRQAALIGCGALGDPQLLNDITNLLADPHPGVRDLACLALAALPGEKAENTVIGAMLGGDEEVRQAAAESLAEHGADGRQILEEAAAHEDLLTRRAAVFGLMQVREAWAKKVLEKLAIEDGQWVVRNAAAQALEMLQQRPAIIPKHLPATSDSAWLLTFASKLGMGLLPGQPATDVLLLVLKSGTVEEQIAALYYLREQPEDQIFEAIYKLLYSRAYQMQEPALHALWWMSIAGANLPNPAQFGLA